MYLLVQRLSKLSFLIYAHISLSPPPLVYPFVRNWEGNCILMHLPTQTINIAPMRKENHIIDIGWAPKSLSLGYGVNKTIEFLIIKTGHKRDRDRNSMKTKAKWT